MRVDLAKGMREQHVGNRPLRRVSGVSLVFHPISKVTRNTHIVKQSNMKDSAAGVIVALTSSGIGGASFRLPSL